MSAEATETAEWTPPPHPTEFRSPKVEELYFKLIELEKEELKLLSKITLAEIGIDIEEEERKRAEMLEQFKAAGGTIAGGGDASVEEEEVKTAFDLKLIGFDAKSKIKVIKEVRAIAGLGLKEAKELVEGAPKVIKKGLKLEEAEELKAKLVELGAEIEVS
eukprot:CAMPEP_0194210730 /NCGR_PEP_ID=MMETSP0156-20130528/9046_1 /TAXON_ID=33649 /ORGANISM="Thalassionema nitzschioides, Strain L26-B" /LENGTH=160 /DNA_ID=CAMNT_0038938111 /DNA_START=205 /DNA_END=687 /DNA_ORIENTATION=-